MAAQPHQSCRPRSPPGWVGRPIDPAGVRCLPGRHLRRITSIGEGPLCASGHGLVDRIQSLGLELVEIRQLPASVDEGSAELEHQPPDP
jgi:hypothetical protein